MKILIVEDEYTAAKYIANLVNDVLKDKTHSIKIIHSLKDAITFIEKISIDLLLLDLNLHGENGILELWTEHIQS